LQNLHGADDAYEIPQNSEIIVDTERYSVEKCAEQIVAYLRANDYIEYKYITENNLENRQDYMYSKYGGDDFLKAYFLTREKFISKNIRGESFKISREEEGGETNVGLIALLKELKSGNWTEKIKHELDFFVKAFEVRKKIYDDYEIGTVRPALDSGYARIENYILLSGCAYYGYSISGILKYLNAMLKLDDTLLSISDRMNDEEKNNLAILLKLETKLIKIERERR